MRPSHTTLLMVIATVVLVACIDMSAPSGAFSISSLQLPSPSVVVGDVMRDSNGTPAPVGLTAYDVNGLPIHSATPQFFITDSGGVAHLDANHNLVGDRLGVVHLFGQIGSLQTAIANVPVTSAPFKLSRNSSTDTLNAPFPTDSAASIKSVPFSVSLKSAGGAPSQGFIVRYVLQHAPASLPSATGPAVYLANSAGKLSTVDTTDASGNGNHFLVVNSLALADQALLAGTKIDSAVISASTAYRGAIVDAPQTFVIRIKVTFGK